MEVDDADVWSRSGECIICRQKPADEQEKEQHRKSAEHLRKLKVYIFQRDDLPHHLVSNIPSELLERHKLKKTMCVGLQQIIEIQQLSFSEPNKSNFWACSICYEAGDSFESSDTHLRSMNHIRNYMIELEEEQDADIYDQCDNEVDKFELYQSAAITSFNHSDGLQPPEVILRMDKKTDVIREKLGISTDNDDKLSVHICPDKENQSVLNCNTCYEVIPITTNGKKQTIDKARTTHCEQPEHRRCSTIRGYINEFNPEEKIIEYRATERQKDLHWEETEHGVRLSQPVGLRYVITAGTDNMCLLCSSIVESRRVDHCSGEFHAMKFLNLIHSYNSYLARQLSGSARRQRVAEILRQAMDLGNDTRIMCANLTRLPASLKEHLNQETQNYHENPEFTIDWYKETTGKIHVFCQNCCTYIDLDANIVNTPEKLSAAFLKHTKSPEHFDISAIRARTVFSPELFVPYPPTIITSSETHPKGVWSQKQDILVQTQCDVGLECMVEDDNEQEVVCKCCWQVFSRNLPGPIAQHIRSYEHLKKYMFQICPEESAGILLGTNTAEQKQAYLLDYLQRHSGQFPKRMLVYSKLKALELTTWAPVPQRTVVSAITVTDSDRDVYDTVVDLVDKVTEDGAENLQMTAREALLAAQVFIINTTRGLNKELHSAICRCLECEHLVVVNAATWHEDVFRGHVCTDEHHRRRAVLQVNKVSAYGLHEEMSNYKVNSFNQLDASKKCLWTWNASTKKHDYVASIVGLDDIIERRHLTEDQETTAEFLCLICAKTFQKRAAALESHVRDISHCINWVHKHRPGQIRELNDQLADTSDKSKKLRAYLASILKDIHPPQDYCIRIWDPEGEENRRRDVEIKKIQEEEKKRQDQEKRQRNLERQRQLKLEVEERNRKIAEDKRIKMEDEAERKRKEALKQAQLLAEKEARLQYARENAKFLLESKEDMSLKSRLEQASRMDREQRERQHINVQQAKLEAERIHLLSRMPGQPRTVPDPQLVIMPQLKSQNITLAGQVLVPNCPPPGYEMSRNPYAMPPPRLEPTRPAFTMSFAGVPKQESPAVLKRPSLRGQQVDTAIHNALKIRNRKELLAHMRERAAVEIDESEIPHEFIQKVQDNQDAFGVDFVAEVICLDDPELDSYLCTICDEWASPRGMMRHLCSSEHKATFLYHKYRPYFKECEKEKDPDTKRNIFKNFIKDLKQKQVGNTLKLRMNTIVDKQTIERLWPSYTDQFYAPAPKQQWSSSFQQVSGPSVAVPKAIPVVTLIDDSDEEKSEKSSSRRDGRRGGRERSRSRDRVRRSRSRTRSRSRDRRRRRSSRSRSRSRSRDRHHRRGDRHRTRSRSRSPKSRSRSRSRDRAPRAGENTWSTQTDSFLARLGEVRGSTSSRPRTSSKDDYKSKLATVRDMAQTGVIQGAQISMEEHSRSSSFSTPQPVAPPVPSAREDRRSAKQREEEEANMRRKIMGVLMMLQKMLEEYQGNVPRSAILQMYQEIGLNPEDGDREINKMLENMRGKQTPAPTTTSSINASISSLGIQLNPPQYQQSQPYQYSAPPVATAPTPQYGIASSAPSAYAQAFHVAPTPPVTTVQAPAPSTSSAPKKSFYETANEKPVQRHDSDDEDGTYGTVFDIFSEDKQKGSNNSKGKQVGKEETKKAAQQPPKEIPLIPGQKMALKRTILPSGERVEKEKPAPIASPPPSEPGQAAPITQALPSRPSLETSFGIPAPVSISKPPPVQQPPPQYATPYQPQTSAYQHPQYPPQTYQLPPTYQAQQPVQYGIQQGYPQQAPVQQYVYQQQPVVQQTMYQQPQYPGAVPQQQYYQQPPPQQQQPQGPQYGIGAPNQQYYSYQ